MGVMQLPSLAMNAMDATRHGCHPVMQLPSLAMDATQPQCCCVLEPEDTTRPGLHAMPGRNQAAH